MSEVAELPVSVYALVALVLGGTLIFSESGDGSSRVSQQFYL